MSDLDLLLFGCVVMFTAVAGVYVVARERFVYTERPKPALQPVRIAPRRATSHPSRLSSPRVRAARGVARRPS